MMREFVVTHSDTGKLISSIRLRYPDETDASIRKVFKGWAKNSISSPDLMRVQTIPTDDYGRPHLGPIFSFFYRGGHLIFLPNAEQVKFKFGYLLNKKNRTILEIIPLNVKNIRLYDVKLQKEWITKAKKFLTEKGNKLESEELPPNLNCACWFGDILMVIDNSNLFIFSDRKIEGVNYERKAIN